MMRLLTALMFLCFGSNAQWVNYNSFNSSLPDNSVRCIAFETDSIIWIGTDFGLVRLENGIMNIYNTSNSLITDNSIRCLTVDSLNRKWIGTFLGGFSVFNDTTFTSFTTANAPLPDDHIKDIQFDVDNSTWLATTAGLVSIDSSGVWKTYNSATSPLVSNNISRVYVEGDLKTVGTVNGGLSLVTDTLITTFTIANSGIPDNSINDIHPDLSGNYWLASPANGLMAKVASGGWTNFTPFNSGIHSSALTAVELDAAGRIWMGSIDSGLIMKSGLSFVSWNTSNSVFADNHVLSLSISNTGKICVGTMASGIYISDVSALTPVNEHQHDVFKIYPNPSKDFLYINGIAGTTFRILTLQGTLLMEFAAGSGPADIQTLPPGVYIIQSEGLSTKFIKL